MITNDRAPSATGSPEGPSAGGGWRELIEEAREAKETTEAGAYTYCRICGGVWPCLHARLADALEASVHDCVCSDNVVMLQDLLTAAERRAAELDEHYEALYQLQADAVRHHIDRTATAERRAAELEEKLGLTARAWSMDEAKALMHLPETEGGVVAWRYLLHLEQLLLAVQSERDAAARRAAELDGENARLQGIVDGAESEAATARQMVVDAEIARVAAERRAAEETERAEVAGAGLHRYAELYEASHAALLARQATTEKQEPARHPSDCECYPCWQRSESR